jgi:hypothetical protein
MAGLGCYVIPESLTFDDSVLKGIARAFMLPFFFWIISKNLHASSVESSLGSFGNRCLPRYCEILTRQLAYITRYRLKYIMRTTAAYTFQIDFMFRSVCLTSILSTVFVLNCSYILGLARVFIRLSCYSCLSPDLAQTFLTIDGSTQRKSREIHGRTRHANSMSPAVYSKYLLTSVRIIYGA